MGQKFCTVCGAVLPEGVKFCESCGAAVGQIPPASAPRPVSQPPVTIATPPTGAVPGGKPMAKIIAGIVIVLVVLAGAAYFFVLPKLAGGSSPSFLPGGTGTPVITSATVVVATSPPATVATTVAPTPAPDPFPNALQLKDGFPFGSGKVASEATVYRIWINDTYEWHNDMDNKYYPQKANAGNKYLFVFLNVYNKGDTRVWPPTPDSVKIHYNGVVYSPDPVHVLPDKSSDRKASAIEIQEIQYFSKLFGSEYVEDYGYSHGTQYAYLYPGKSNAIDGYLIYQVPVSLTPDKAYARIEFNGNDAAVWKLG